MKLVERIAKVVVLKDKKTEDNNKRAMASVQSALNLLRAMKETKRGSTQ